MILSPTLTLSAGSGAAIVRPTFSRDFAGERTLNNGTGPAITFTRGSIGTFFDAAGTLQTASNDVARFDHSGGSSLGLLIEESRQNLFERSEEFDNAYWAKITTTVTANDAISPAGTTTADLVEKTGNDATTPAKTLAVTAAAHTASVFVKNSSGNRFRLRIDATGGTIVDAVYNTATGAVVSSSAGVTATITDAGNGWYRCAAIYTFASAVNATVGLCPRNEAADATGAKAWIWGAQLEAGAFPTSYIPTTSAAVTRSADSAVVTPISGFYNQSEGTFVTATNKSPLSGSFPTIWHLTNGTDDVGNVIGFYNPSNSTISYDASPAFSFAESVSAGLAVSGFAFSATSARMAVNGVLEPSTDQSATITTDKAALRIGAKRNGSEPLNGHIRRIAYFPKRLSNALLQSLTT